jgi:type II secretory ATPase GspE/PulE/Tfp pilus assembly ATPase PilB-like protein
MGTGYLGRTAIYEILIVDGRIRKAILENKDSDEIKRLAVNRGMKTLRMDGAEKVKMGITTPEEVLRVTRG